MYFTLYKITTGKFVFPRKAESGTNFVRTSWDNNVLTFEAIKKRTCTHPVYFFSGKALTLYKRGPIPVGLWPKRPTRPMPCGLWTGCLSIFLSRFRTTDAAEKNGTLWTLWCQWEMKTNIKYRNKLFWSCWSTDKYMLVVLILLIHRHILRTASWLSGVLKSEHAGLQTGMTCQISPFHCNCWSWTSVCMLHYWWLLLCCRSLDFVYGTEEAKEKKNAYTWRLEKTSLVIVMGLWIFEGYPLDAPILFCH